MKKSRFNPFAPSSSVTRAARLVTLAVMVTAAVPSAEAVEKIWGGVGSTTTTVTFNSASNWDGGVVPSGSITGDTVAFGTTGNIAPELNTAARSVLGFTFNSGANAFTFGSTFSGGNVLSIGGSGITNSATNTQTFGSAITLVVGASHTWNTVAGGTLQINGIVDLSNSGTSRNLIIAGAGTTNISNTIKNSFANINTLTVTSTGTTTLSGNNTYSGLTTMNAVGGILTLSGNNLGAAGGVTLTQGTLNMNSVNALGSGTLTLTELSILNNTSGSAKVNAVNNAVSWTGATPGAFTFGTAASTLANNLDLGTGTVTATTSRAMTFAGTGTTLSMGTLDSISTTGSRTFTFSQTGTGNTMVLAGIKLSNAAAPTTTTLAGNANLTVSGTIVDGTSSQIVGVNVTGTGATVFNGANTYRGVTAISSGSSLQIGNNSALGTTDNGTTVASGGTLDLNGQTVGAEAVSLSGTSGAPALANTGGNASLSGAVTLGSSSTYVNAGASGTITLSGGVGDAGGAKGLVKDGSGTLILTGTSSYTGATKVNQGILQVNGAAALAGGSTLNSSSSSSDNTKLLLGSVGTYTMNTLSIGGYMKIDGSGSTLNFSNAGAGNGFTGSSARKLEIFSGTTVNVAGAYDLAPLTLGANVSQNIIVNGTLNFNGGLTKTHATFTGGFTKTGAGTMTIDGTSDYTGPTTISQGILSVGADANLGAATNPLVFSGGTLQVTGTALTNFGTHALTFTAGQTVGLDITNVANSFTVSQVLNQTSGGLTKSGAGTLNLAATNSYTGPTTLSGGVLNVTTFADATFDSGIGNTSTSGTNLIFNGGTLQHTAANVASTDRRFTLGTGGGTIDSSAVLASDTLSFTSVSSTTYYIGLGARSLTLTGTNTGANIMNYQIDDDSTVGSGPTSLVKNGVGTWEINSGNLYSGGTTLNAGQLAIGSTNALGTGPVTINGGKIAATAATSRTLANNFIIAGNFTLGGNGSSTNISGTVDLGGTTRILTLGNSSTWNGNVSGTGGITASGSGKTFTLSGVNTYTGPTTMSVGTLSLVGGSQSSPVSISSGAFVQFTLGSPTTSTSTLTLVSGAKVRIVGTPTLASYTLITTASPIAALPVLDTPITGYDLVIDGNSLKLNATASGYSSWASTNAGGQAANLDFDNDGVSNGVEYFMGQTGSTFTPNPGIVSGRITWPYDTAANATFKVQISETLALGDWTDIVPPNASIDTTTNPNQVTYTLPTGAAKKFCRLVVIVP